MALRAAGDLAALMPLRAGAGALQVAAIVVFAATMIAHLRR